MNGTMRLVGVTGEWIAGLPDSIATLTLPVRLEPGTPIGFVHMVKIRAGRPGGLGHTERYPAVVATSTVTAWLAEPCGIGNQCWGDASCPSPLHRERLLTTFAPLTLCTPPLTQIGCPQPDEAEDNPITDESGACGVCSGSGSIPVPALAPGEVTP